MDTWRAAYGGIVPDDYLASLSYVKSEQLWRDAIGAGGRCVFVAEVGNGAVFGFASGRRRRDFSQGLEGYEGELETLYVLPSGQGSGTGRRLVGAIARCLADAGVYSMLLWVFAENGPARRFYESFGGMPVAEDDFEIGGTRLVEVAYGWKDTSVLYEDAAWG